MRFAPVGIGMTMVGGGGNPSSMQRPWCGVGGGAPMRRLVYHGDHGDHAYEHGYSPGAFLSTVGVSV